jgi:hypothetical protein
VKPKLYLETTVPSYLAARPSRDIVVAGHQKVTRQWWAAKRHEFDVFVSQFVLDEAGAGDSATAAARLNLLEGMPLLEITADVGRLARLTRRVFAACLELGFTCPTICTPEELLESES